MTPRRRNLSPAKDGPGLAGGLSGDDRVDRLGRLRSAGPGDGKLDYARGPGRMGGLAASGGRAINRAAGQCERKVPDQPRAARPGPDARSFRRDASGGDRFRLGAVRGDDVFHPRAFSSARCRPGPELMRLSTLHCPGGRAPSRRARDARRPDSISARRSRGFLPLRPLLASLLGNRRACSANSSTTSRSTSS